MSRYFFAAGLAVLAAMAASSDVPGLSYRLHPSPAQLEAYSSLGGAPTLFDASGTRLAVPIVRQKPDFVGPDGANDTFSRVHARELGSFRRKIQYLHRRMPEQSRFSKFLRHVGGDAPRRRHRGALALAQAPAA